MQNSCFSRITQARSKNIDLGYEGERSAVMIAGDGVLLAELCANLLDNAIRYTPANGTVTWVVVASGDIASAGSPVTGTSVAARLRSVLMPRLRSC